MLLIRVWTETGAAEDLRARIVAAEPDLPSQVLATQVGTDRLCDVIEAWVAALVGRS